MTRFVGKCLHVNPMNTQTRIVNQVKARESSLTIKQLAAFTNRTPAMIRRVLPNLLNSGEVYITGKRLTGKRGQPAKLYGRRVTVTNDLIPAQ